MADPQYPGTPRWVKGLAIAGIIALVIFLALHLTRRAPFGHDAGHTASDRIEQTK
jgi:hypothetical protein